jgi:hypothetical protein
MSAGFSDCRGWEYTIPPFQGKLERNVKGRISKEITSFKSVYHVTYIITLVAKRWVTAPGYLSLSPL